MSTLRKDSVRGQVLSTKGRIGRIQSNFLCRNKRYGHSHVTNCAFPFEGCFSRGKQVTIPKSQLCCNRRAYFIFRKVVRTRPEYPI